MIVCAFHFEEDTPNLCYTFCPGKAASDGLTAAHTHIGFARYAQAVSRKADVIHAVADLRGSTWGSAGSARHAHTKGE